MTIKNANIATARQYMNLPAITTMRNGLVHVVRFRIEALRGTDTSGSKRCASSFYRRADTESEAPRRVPPQDLIPRNHTDLALFFQSCLHVLILPLWCLDADDCRFPKLDFPSTLAFLGWEDSTGFLSKRDDY